MGLFFSMAAWADFMTSCVCSMLMFHVAWGRGGQRGVRGSEHHEDQERTKAGSGQAKRQR